MLVQSMWASIGPKCTIYSHVDRQMGPLSCMVGLVPLAPNLYMVKGEGSYKYGAWLPRISDVVGTVPAQLFWYRSDVHLRDSLQGLAEVLSVVLINDKVFV